MFNIIDLIVIAVILFSVFLGYKKGFIKSAINLVSFFVAIGLALMFYKPLAVILAENTQVDDWIIENIVTSAEENETLENAVTSVEENETLENTATSAEENDATENENDKIFDASMLEILNNLPDVVTKNFNFEEIKNNAKEELAYQASELIMNLLSLIVIYVVVKITLVVAVFVLDGIMKFPVLKQLNEILGMAFGAVLGFIQVYIAFAVITFISSICDITAVIEYIKISSFASVLFENNIIINLLF